MTGYKEYLEIFWQVAKKFRYFVEGTKFKIATDINALKYLINLKYLNGWLARWFVEIQIYDLEVGPKKEVNLVVLDALSRTHDDFIKVATIEYSDKIEDEWYLQRFKNVQLNWEKFRVYKV